MQSFWFWKTWSPDYRYIWWGLAILLITSFLFFAYSYGRGPSGVIDWETFHQQITRESVSHTFDIGNFEFSVPIESYLTFEYFNGTPVNPNITASYIFLFGLVVCALMLLSIITTLDRFWFITGMGLFILFMVGLRLEVLRLFGISGRMLPIIIMALYVLISFYFNALRSSSPFLLRLFVFSVLTLILGIVIYLFSGVYYPFLHLSTTGYLPGLILTVIFILMIAHEIMAAFIYITSSGTSSSKSLRHFFIISMVYLINLVLTYMHEAGIIDWKFLYINLYLLLTISTVLGIWGFRQREVLYGNILRFNPLGAYLIVSMACITFFTTGMLMGNHNDAPLKIISDVIIFSHLGYGGIFFIYVVSNFMIMMAENLSAYKVLYKPSRMPYFTFRFAGLIATMAFVFYSNWHTYVYNGVAGFYNHLGDLYALQEKRMFAEAYYQQGRRNGFQNNRSNYTLGLIEANKNDFKNAHFHYELANSKRPTVYSLINDGNLYLIEGRYFEGIASFAHSLQQFSSNGILENNLGYAYSRIHKLDSALYLFNNARKQRSSGQTAESNFLAIIGNEYLPVKADSLLKKFTFTAPLAVSNALAVATLQRQSFTYTFDPFAKPRLDLATAAQLNNYLAYSLKQLDTTAVNKAHHIISDSANREYSEALKATLAQAFYHQNNVAQALSTMSELAYLSQIMQGKYNYIAGLWALEQGASDLASSYFSYAVLFDYKEAKLYNAIALAEAGDLTSAQIAADSLLADPDDNVREIGRQLKKIISHPASAVSSLSDLEKYQYCRYRLRTADTIQFQQVVNSIQQNNYKVSALLDMSERQFHMSNMATAINYLNQAGDVPVTDRKLIDRAKHHELIMLASRGELRALANQVNEGVSFPKERELEKLLYQALISEASGDSLTAEKNYTVLARYNPFFEEGIIAAARYFKNHPTDDMRAYGILAEAIQVNTTSYRLWMAYVAEAYAVGFDNQAEDGLQQARVLKQRK